MFSFSLFIIEKGLLNYSTPNGLFSENTYLIYRITRIHSCIMYNYLNIETSIGYFVIQYNEYFEC